MPLGCVTASQVCREQVFSPLNALLNGRLSDQGSKGCGIPVRPSRRSCEVLQVPDFGSVISLLLLSKVSWFAEKIIGTS